MRGKSLVFSLALGVLAAGVTGGTAAAQGAGGRWEAYSPKYYSVPQTSWIKAEVLAEDPVSVRVGQEVNELLRRRGHLNGPGGAYAVRLEMRGKGLSTPVVPIPGYSNAAQRLSIWPEADRPDAIYVSLMLYHQSTGQVFWQGEAVCTGLPADAPNIINAMVGPLMQRIGTSGKSSLSCGALR
jgi:hypothetical protein